MTRNTIVDARVKLTTSFTPVTNQHHSGALLDADDWSKLHADSQLRKVTKTKAAFPTDDALLKALYLAMQDITRKWTMRLPHGGR